MSAAPFTHRRKERKPGLRGARPQSPHSWQGVRAFKAWRSTETYTMKLAKRHRFCTPSARQQQSSEAGNHSQTLPAQYCADHAGGVLWPSHSQEPKYAHRLAQEVALHWVKPQAQAPGWLRESFRTRKPTTSALWAFTTDSRGRIVRAFIADRACIAAYAALQRLECGTCPIEAVRPASIALGLPAEPAHSYLLQLQGVGQ